MASTIETFICYSQKDEKLRQEFENHLKPLEREGLISIWHERKIELGKEYEIDIRSHLDKCQIIFLLVSPDFIASDYCDGNQMKRAMERHEAREAIVIPILLRPTHWHRTPFGKLQALPKNGNPVTSRKWPNKDHAFKDIAGSIYRAFEEQPARSERYEIASLSEKLAREYIYEQPSASTGLSKCTIDEPDGNFYRSDDKLSGASLLDDATKGHLADVLFGREDTMTDWETLIKETQLLARA